MPSPDDLLKTAMQHMDRQDAGIAELLKLNEELEAHLRAVCLAYSSSRYIRTEIYQANALLRRLDAARRGAPDGIMAQPVRPDGCGIVD